MLRTTVFIATLTICSGAAGQDLQETLESVGAEYGSRYVVPLTNSLGADLNAGLFHTARSGSGLFGLNVYVGVKVAGMFVDPAQQRFSLNFPTEVNFDYDLDGETYTFRVPVEFSVNEAPTIFGDREAAIASAHVTFDTTIVHQGDPLGLSIDTTITQELIGGLINTRIAPLVVPHASFGSIMGTDVSVRWLPRISHPDYGHIRLVGGGVRHSVSQYLKLLPVDVAVSASWQSLDTRARAGGDFSVNIETFAYGIVVSRSIPLLTVYGGLQRERTIVDYAYMFDGEIADLDEPIDVAFTHRASQRGRFVMGVTLNLGPVITNVDYAVGNERVASAGIGFGF